MMPAPSGVHCGRCSDTKPVLSSTSLASPLPSAFITDKLDPIPAIRTTASLSPSGDRALNTAGLAGGKLVSLRSIFESSGSRKIVSVQASYGLQDELSPELG